MLAAGGWNLELDTGVPGAECRSPERLSVLTQEEVAGLSSGATGADSAGRQSVNLLCTGGCPSRA